MPIKMPTRRGNELQYQICNHVRRALDLGDKGKGADWSIDSTAPYDCGWERATHRWTLGGLLFRMEPACPLKVNTNTRTTGQHGSVTALQS